MHTQSLLTEVGNQTHFFLFAETELSQGTELPAKNS